VKNGERQPPTCPPSLRFAGSRAHGAEENREAQQRAVEHVFIEAPKTGRQTQLHLFISILNSGKPPCDFLTAFLNAIISFDCSFATAICVLASEPVNLKIIRDLVTILEVHKMFDHFLRCLSVFIRSAVPGFLVQEIPELFALDNMFMAHSFDWARALALQFGGRGIETLMAEPVLEAICSDIRNGRVPSEALYILRAALVVAAYEDPKGDIALSVLLEICARPFMIGLGLGNAYITLKGQLSRRDPQVRKMQQIVQATVDDVLAMDIVMKVFSPASGERELVGIHQFVTQKLDSFIQLVVCLNSREKTNHPVIQMARFAFDKCAELAFY
jgi:hypothetical protein